MNFTATQIAEAIDGEIDGDPSVTVNRFSTIEDGLTGSITFLSNPKFEGHLYTTKAAVVIVSKTFSPSRKVEPTLIRVADPHQSITKLLAFAKGMQRVKRGIDERAIIDPTATFEEDVFVGALAYVGANTKLGKGVRIYPQVYVGENVVIGENTILYPGVRIYSNTIIGKESTLQSGAVIGGEGFGFAPNSDNKYDKVFHLGNVRIGDHVEIGANTTIDRGTIGSTIIGNGVKLDNLIQIAHNVEVGDHTVIAAQTGIAGSVRIGKNCMIGGQVGIAGHIEIADQVKIAAQSGVSSSLSKGEIVMGTPAMPIRDFKKSYIYFKQFPNLVDQIRNLDKESKR
jgi:UDP-3-O-[3-hydroxymyristoyl] glucosamine N-acyltransferase